MTISLKACVLLVLVSTAMGMTPLRYVRNHIANEQLDPNDLTPPFDPAINAFPKEPVVPLVPTCAHSGYFRDPYNCGKFYSCSYVDDIPKTFYCQRGLIFNEMTEVCDDPSRVAC